MKKTVTLPDGSTEVVEGTAEEIAAYEKAKKHDTANESPKSKKKILLTEEKVREIAKEEAAKQPHTHFCFGSHHCSGCKCFEYPKYPWYTQPIWIGTPDPLIPYLGDPLPGTYTSDSVKLQDLLESPVKTSAGTLPFLGTYSVQS
jgi:hypothetical protein